MEKKKISEKELYNWCLEQVAQLYIGDFEEYKVRKLDSEGFPWVFYGHGLHQLGFDWDKNLPEKPHEIATQLYDIFKDKDRDITYEQLFKDAE